MSTFATPSSTATIAVAVALLILVTVVVVVNSRTSITSPVAGASVNVNTFDTIA